MTEEHETPGRQWKIFISHSARTEKIEPKVESPSIAGLILKDLRAELEAEFEILIDDDLPPGKNWEPGIHWWLAECDAAIVLLDQKAFDSDWVKREVCILAHRRALSPNLFVYPVLINLTPEELKNTIFSDLLSIQDKKCKVSPGDRHHEVVKEIAEAVRKNCPGQPADVSDAMFTWIHNVADQLPMDDYRLKNAARELGFDRARSTMGANRRMSLASHFLNVRGSESELDKVAKAVAEMTWVMKDYQRSNLAELLPPVWVDVERARRLLPHPDLHEVRRLALLPAKDTQTGEHYVSRALCCSTSLRRVVVQASGAPTGERTGENNGILDDVKNAMKVLLRNRGNSSCGPRSDLQYFLIMPCGDVTAQKEAIEWVHGEYPRVNILKLTGADNPVVWKNIEESLSSTMIQLDAVDADVEDSALQWAGGLVCEVLKVGETRWGHERR